MKGVSINGKKLHEVQMKLESYNKGTVCHLRYPKTRIQFEPTESGMLLQIPSFLALELFRVGIVPQNPDDIFPVSIGKKRIGFFQVVDCHYPNTLSRDRELISIQLRQVFQESASTKP